MKCKFFMTPNFIIAHSRKDRREQREMHKLCLQWFVVVLFSFLLLFFVVVFLYKVYLCSPGYPESHSVD